MSTAVRNKRRAASSPTTPDAPDASAAPAAPVTPPQVDQSAVLLAICDVLMVKALEATGKRIVRRERHRHAALAGRPWHIAHTLWQPEVFMTQASPRGSWDVIGALMAGHGCNGVEAAQVEAALEAHFRQLVRTGTPHTTATLRDRLETLLRIDLAEPLVAASHRAESCR